MNAGFSRLMFGGSFDPVHAGHIAIMRYVLAEKITSRLDIVPARVSPFKTDRPPLFSDERRLDFLRIAARLVRDELALPEPEGDALRDADPIRILDFELNAPPPSYTARTLRWLRETRPGERIGLLVGSDSFRGFYDWMEPGEILKAHALVVFRRRGDQTAELEEIARELRARFAPAACEFVFLDNPLVDCSSTAIRAALRAGRPDDAADCLPGAIRKALDEKRPRGGSDH